MVFMYSVTLLALPILLYYVTLRLAGNTTEWWKVLLTAVVLDVIMTFAWTDYVTKPMCAALGIADNGTSIIECAGNSFFAAAFTEELQKTVMAILLLLCFYRKTGITAWGIFKTILAAGVAFGLEETLAKTRYLVFGSDVYEYVKDNISYHINTFTSLVIAELEHYFFALVMGAFFVKAFRADSIDRYKWFLIGICSAILMHFTNNFITAVLYLYQITGTVNSIIHFGINILYISVVFYVWRRTDVVQLLQPKST